MSSANDLPWMLGGLYVLMAIATAIAKVLQMFARNESMQKTMQNVMSRMWAWWFMLLVFTIALLGGRIVCTILFALVSFCALREFLTITPTKPADHRTLFWAFFVILPLQYFFVATNWYGMFAVFIPVYAFLFVPMRSVFVGDCERFLERASEIQWGLMVCVFCVSHVPALLMLDIPGYSGKNAQLLLFLIFIVELSDILQYVWGKTCGKRQIAPHVSPNKTVEGFFGGVLSTTVIGTLLAFVTPFTVLQTFLISLIITLMGFSGGLVMSAIKRDRGVKDYGTMLGGHGGMLDRIDSLCFAAPVFFHLVRYYYTL